MISLVWKCDDCGIDVTFPDIPMLSACVTDDGAMGFAFGYVRPPDIFLNRCGGAITTACYDCWCKSLGREPNDEDRALLLAKVAEDVKRRTQT